jgi:hypothetical protein
MHDFFRGWRRKAGVITLVIACAFLVTWLRSLAMQDHLAVGQRYSVFTTYNGVGLQQIQLRKGIRFCNLFDSYNLESRATPMAPNWWRDTIGQNMKPEDDLPAIARRHDHWLGFEYAKSTWSQIAEPFVYGYVTYVVCPHWFLCLSATALSAYLILIPARKTPLTTSQRHA